MNPYADVRAFHLRMGFPAPTAPQLTLPSGTALRVSIVREEARELCEALLSGDLARIAQEAVDVVYVAVGALVEHGLPMEAVWDAVHAANMQKAPDPRGSEFKAIKPEGWRKPDVAAIIEAAPRSTP